MIDYSENLMKKEEEINEKLFNIFLKGSENEFTRWMDKQRLCYPSNLTLYAYVSGDTIKVVESVVDYYNAYIPKLYDIEFAGCLDEVCYPGVSGKCVEFLKNNKPELYREISDFIK